MSVTSREIDRSRPWPINAPRVGIRLPLRTLATLLALAALYLVLSSTVEWGRVKLDDLRYGMPRTFHLTADVGHSGATGQPSHLIALNLDRQVVVLDLPGGAIDEIRTLPGPYLFGADEHLTPVTLDLQDMNTDGAPDLIVRVKDEEIIYLNQEGSFSLTLPTAAQPSVAAPR